MKHKSRILSRISGLLLFTFFISYLSFGQRVAINTDGSAADSSALLDIKSTSGGLLIPRMNTAQRTTIPQPAVGLMVYDTETNSFWCYAGSSWVELLAGYVALLSDADQDTKVEVEKTTDDDLIRFSMAGTEYFRMDSGRLEVINTGGSVLIGEDAGLHDDRSGSGNVAIGSAALKHNSDRSGHVAIGDSALYYNGSGPGVTEAYHATKNTAIGDHSLFNNTSGDDNTAVGFLSLYSNESGWRNSAFGKEALYSNDSARYNNAFGNRALYSNTGGSFNIAVGASAMYSNTTGNHNTAVGNRPLNNNIVGSDNVAIGAEAGFMSDGSGNIFLGYRAGYHETNDDRLYIHNDSSSMPLLYGEFDNDLLRINGHLELQGHNIKEVADPLQSQDAATKAYVDQMSEMMLNAGLNGVVEDIDGNVYKTIKIGTQVWMAENLKTTRYNDGTVIPEVTASSTWLNLTTPAYSWYGNDSITNAPLYGALYNYYTVADTNSLNVCPTGWHVPSDAEWIVSMDFLEVSGYGYGGSGADIGKSMAATFRWNSSEMAGEVGNDLGSNNSSGFAGLPGANRFYTGTFSGIGNHSSWWSSTEINAANALNRNLFLNNDSVGGGSFNKRYGFSVRCLKD